MTFAYFNHQFVPLDQAKISIKNNTFQYGTGIFEGIRAYWNSEHQQLYIFRMGNHYARMLKNAKVFNFNINKNESQLINITLDLLRKNSPKFDTYIRPMIYLDAEGIGPKFVNYPSAFSMYTLPLGDYVNTETGIKVCFSSWRRIHDNMIPARCKTTGAYINSALAKTEALSLGYDEAIMLNAEGYISEGSAENIFIVRDGKLITPGVSSDILEGITRETVIDLAIKELGITTIERSISRTELYVADEAFLCGTGAQIAPIISVDQKTLKDGKVGPITSKLENLYFNIVRGNNPNYKQWLTPVY